RREARQRYDTAIIRIEQLYPLHGDLLKEIVGRYPGKAQQIWAQEEPRNVGAFLWMDDVFRNQMGFKEGLAYVGREASATPAIGDTHMSDEQQDAVLSKAIGPNPKPSAHQGPGGNGATAAQAGARAAGKH